MQKTNIKTTENKEKLFTQVNKSNLKASTLRWKWSSIEYILPLKISISNAG